jgi:hypothetical protein
MRFSDILKGTNVYRVIDFPLAGLPESKQVAKIKLRCLRGDESAQILGDAAGFAKSRNGTPSAGDPLYELGLRVHTILIGCVDPDHPDPESESARFFASVDEVLESPLIGRDGIWFLYECQESWQDHVSPNLTAMSEGEFYRKIVEVAESNDPLVFAGWRPAIQWSFMRSMAHQLLIVLQDKSSSGQSSDADTTSALKTPARKPRKQR